MATIRRFEDLQIWQCANALYKELRCLIMKIRAHKDFRFAEQLKSAAGSIMDNIAEGFERTSSVNLSSRWAYRQENVVK
jgi:four helix bundle protein